MCTDLPPLPFPDTLDSEAEQVIFLFRPLAAAAGVIFIVLSVRNLFHNDYYKNRSM
jgi:hypothetical protein